MTTTNKVKEITVETTINAPVEKVWECYTNPKHVTQWNHASDDWHSPKAENDLRPGGKFNYRMEAKDGSFGFDFGGVYDEVKQNRRIRYTIGDGRHVDVKFEEAGNKTKVVTIFEAESVNDPEMQRGGWQAILDNFKKHVETEL
ncbi:MAG: polyketide cyclase [Bacteroidetes bacterium]|nr:MAG: polyketide cyclase [Bacteroidota bacterium]